MNKRCFIVMSFMEKYDEVYELGIKRAVVDYGYECFRLDEDPGPKHIPERLIRELIDADLVIVDITEANPNVYYELGISHTIGNKTILLTQNINQLPFDIRGEFVVAYSPGRDGYKLLKMNLTNAIKRLEENTGFPTNMVQIAGRGHFDMRKRLEERIEDLNKERARIVELREYLSKGRRITDNKEVIQAIAEKLCNLFSNGEKRHFISMCGPAGLGKSRLTDDVCKELCKRNGNNFAKSLPLDSFMKNRVERVYDNISGYDIKANNIDEARNAIHRLRNGESIEFTPYNHVTGMHDDSVKLQSTKIIFLDGIHSLHPSIVPEIDYGLFFVSEPGSFKGTSICCGCIRQMLCNSRCFCTRRSRAQSVRETCAAIYTSGGCCNPNRELLEI